MFNFFNKNNKLSFSKSIQYIYESLFDNGDSDDILSNTVDMTDYFVPKEEFTKLIKYWEELELFNYIESETKRKEYINNIINDQNTFKKLPECIYIDRIQIQILNQVTYNLFIKSVNEFYKPIRIFSFYLLCRDDNDNWDYQKENVFPDVHLSLHNLGDNLTISYFTITGGVFDDMNWNMSYILSISFKDSYVKSIKGISNYCTDLYFMYNVKGIPSINDWQYLPEFIRILRIYYQNLDDVFEDHLLRFNNFPEKTHSIINDSAKLQVISDNMSKLNQKKYKKYIDKQFREDNTVMNKRYRQKIINMLKNNIYHYNRY